MTVLPGNATSTAHVSLSDGVTTVELEAVGAGRDPNPLTITRNPVERNPLKTTAGNQTYSDFDPPYTVIAQDNWTSGRGKNKFEADSSGYMDSYGLILDRANKAFLGPREKYSTGLRKAIRLLPGAMNWSRLVTGSPVLQGFTPTESFVMGGVSFWFIKYLSPHNVVVKLHAADNTVLATGGISFSGMEDGISELRFAGMSYSLVAGTPYYLSIELSTSGGLGTGTVDIGVKSSFPAGDYYYSITDVSVLQEGMLIEYKGAIYFFSRDTSPGRMFINGDRGVADAPGAAGVLDDATKSWTVNEWAGCIVQITAGIGLDERKNYRKIVSNTANRLVCDSSWDVTHTIATEYAILGSDKWTEITGHGMTAPITDVVVSNKGIIYVAHGSAANIRRMRFYNNAGTWTGEFADDGTNKALYITKVNASTGWEIWKGENMDVNYDVSVAKAAPQAWGTDLTFGTPLIVGMRDELITSLLAYVDANQAETLWIMTEASPWYIQTGVPVRVPLREYKTVRSINNGKAAAVSSVNLFFNMGVGLERYYSQNLDDLGPNLGEGMPTNRTGRISALVAYPGRVFASIDAGATGYSSVLAYNGAGWNEIYRAPYGRSITAMIFQVIPGTNLDRLWIRQGGDMLYLPMPSDTFDPLKDPAYEYKSDGVLEMSWMTAGLVDAWKYFRKIKLFTEQAVDGHTWINAEYKVDDDTTWTPITDVSSWATVSEAMIGNGVNGKRFKMRLLFRTIDLNTSIILKAAILEAVTVTDTKFMYQLTALFRDGSTSIAQLDTWAGTAKPLTMRCVIPLFDNVEVFLMALPVTVEAVDNRTEGAVSLEYHYRANIILQEA